MNERPAAAKSNNHLHSNNHHSNSNNHHSNSNNHHSNSNNHHNQQNHQSNHHQGKLQNYQERQNQTQLGKPQEKWPQICQQNHQQNNQQNHQESQKNNHQKQPHQRRPQEKWHSQENLYQQNSQEKHHQQQEKQQNHQNHQENHDHHHLLQQREKPSPAASAAAAALKQGQEDRLCNLLSSIGHLSEHGDIPVYAFGTLVSTAPPQAIAEHLHQRWLADPNFAKIAPKIVLQMRSNVTVCSQVLSFALRDFNTRYEIRSESKGMFRNFVRTLVELYPVYRKIDKLLSTCLIEPLFRCLQMLVEESPDDRDLHCLAHVIVGSGQELSQLNSNECDRLILSCRRWLCSNRVLLEEETRRFLMNAVDLWTYSWDPNLFPDSLRTFYEEIEEEERQRKHSLCPKGTHHHHHRSSGYDDHLRNIPPSYSSQQTTDSTSPSLPSPSITMPLVDTQTTITTKSSPQSRTSFATPIDQVHVISNGDSQLNARKLTRESHVDEREEEETNSRDKESTI